MPKLRQFDECGDANNWKAVKKLVGIPLLLTGQAWNIYKLFGEGDNESYDILKYTTISRLNHDINEDWLTAHEQLTRRHFRKGGESIDELAQDIEKLPDRSSLGLPTEVCDCKL